MLSSNANTTTGVTKRRQRKSRARGLRTKTGCITCRKRHMKCDEIKPVCGQCTRSERDCYYEGTVSVPSSPDPPLPEPSTPKGETRKESPRPEDDPRYRFTPPPLTDAVHISHRRDESTATSQITKPLTPSLTSLSVENIFADVVANVDLCLQDGPGVALSPANTEVTHTSSHLLTAELASMRWLGLLAADAAQAEPNFTLSPFPRSGQEVSAGNQTHNKLNQRRHGVDRYTSSFHGLNLDDESRGIGEAGGSGYRDLDQLLYAVDVRTASTSNETRLWYSEEAIKLSDQEVPIFRHFVENLSLWIDLFDPLKHFSTLVPRLALHNAGLMKAILALSLRHLSLNPHAESPIDRNTAVQYYFETLHYLQTALQYESYVRSQELLASVLIISTYEMLDGSNSGWERHLKGVFWIQRSQNIDGDSGGLKQAIWWAWLRQDVWASFRERRRALSFWKPTRPHEALDQHELANRSVYLLAQAVNFCSSEETEAGTRDLKARAERGQSLLSMLDDWRSNLGADFTPLPVYTDTRVYGTATDIEALWFHPPKFGIALQIHSFAKILVLLHRPSVGGFKEFAVCQKLLAECVNIIVGIALTMPEDPSLSVMSAMCLYGAGLCVGHDEKRKLTILEQLEKCQCRTNWPSASLVDELRQEWEKM